MEAANLTLTSPAPLNSMVFSRPEREGDPPASGPALGQKEKVPFAVPVSTSTVVMPATHHQ